jgi:hypothetical protein
MMKWLKSLFENVKFTDKQYAEWYLSQSYDHVDLERRMKELDQRGIKMY